MFKNIDKVIFYSFIFILLTVLTTGTAIALSLNHLPKKIPLFYSQPWGDSQLVSSPQLWSLPLVIVLVTLINIIISWHLHPSQLLLKRVVNLSSVLFSILILITTLKIIFIFL